MWPWGEGVWPRGCGRGGSKITFFSFSKFQKIIIIPKNINLEEKKIIKGVWLRGGGKAGTGRGGLKNYNFFS